MKFKINISLIISIAILTFCSVSISAQEIIYDAEQAILQKQFGEQWASQDKEIESKLAALEKKYGKKPNIIHIMWDDNSLGEVGMPELNKVRGFDTPRINKMGEDGIVFTRMYTEPSCTPTRAAALTGRLAVRSGMHTVAFPPEGAGLHADEVTIAEILSQAGYNTAFYAKAHQGDLEESYMHNQGFDEAQFSLYNQFPPIFWHRDGEMAQTTIGYTPTMTEKKYLVDDTFRPYGYISDIEGKKGEKARETIPPNTIEDYRKLIEMHQEKALDYIRRKANDDKPFYMAYWPHVYDLIAKDMEITTSNSTPFAQNMERLDRHIGEILDELKKQGISENTLVIAMADNGPMKEVPNAMYQVIFNGGKGDYKEGGIRVPAFAQWEGVIESGQVVGDIFAVHDLFTTFAKIGGAMKLIPTDRVIDGIDQTALFLEGEHHGRRDYVYIYENEILRSVVKQKLKMHVPAPGVPGAAAPVFDLHRDPREMFPHIGAALWSGASFQDMIKRHQLTIAQYPHAKLGKGKPYEGIENLRPESVETVETFASWH
jgi:arylsulfatase A-like enzyme